MLNRHRALRTISGNELRWKELLFWTLLLAAFQSLESAQLRGQVTGIVETIAFVAVAISSLSKLGDSDDVDQSFRSDADQSGAKRRRAFSV